MNMYLTDFELLILVAIGIFLLGYLLYLFFRSPFHYPYFKHSFDVSGKRNPDIENYIDEFLINGGFYTIDSHEKEIECWKEKCEKKIKKSLLKRYRRWQYKKSLDDEGAYIFYLTRKQTRYYQINYERTSYKVEQKVKSCICNYDYLFNRNERLKKINYECTIKEYDSNNQRKLMTKELRRQIIRRDKFTCQNCGKYMPDEVGLHVDHIIPISKGGKTVPSNLQVLCSKCNGSKSNK